MSAETLVSVLTEARTLGFLGPGPVRDHIGHALGFVAAADEAPGMALDLGSGGGVPGLVLALRWPASRWVLLDAAERRTDFLRSAAARLGLAGRVTVVRARAEAAGHDESLRGGFDLVTARSFAAPAVTAECGAPFLRVGGCLAVSEPPEVGERWPSDGVTRLGLQVGPLLEDQGGRVQVLIAEVRCPERYPRRVGIPAKRPLF